MTGEPRMPKPRSGSSYRLSEGAQHLLGELAGRLGLSKTSIMEMAIRKLAYAELGETARVFGPDAAPGQRLTAGVPAPGHN